MHTEFEATFLQVNKEQIRQTLGALGASLVHEEYMMKRVVFDPPILASAAWMRVRQEAEKITMSYKQVTGEKIEDQKEAMVVVDDFDEAVLFLETTGAKKKAYQETKREEWKLDGVEVTIDTWPGLHPYVEVEGENQEVVQVVAEKLGFDFNEAVFGAADEIYLRELGIPKEVINNHPEITFENPPTTYVG